MFSLILNLVGSILHVYCAWRVGSLPAVRRGIGTRGWWLGAAALWVAYVAGVRIGDEPDGPIAWVLSQFAFHWLTTLFLVSVCLLAVDLLTGFGIWMKRRLPALRVTAVAAGTVMAVIALVQGLRPPEVTRHDIVLTDLPAELHGTTLAAVSDMHLSANIDSDWLAARVARINALQPDFVVMLGDLTEGEAGQLSGVKEAMSGLHAPLGAWAVTGNHEGHGHAGTTLAVFASAGVRWLRDSTVELRPGLRLAGLDYRRKPSENRRPTATLLDSLAGTRDGASILLAHEPRHAEAADDAGFDLMLSGHTHGGQVWPFSCLVRTRYKYFVGRYRVGGMQLLVSRGAGTWGARMRLWKRGEIMHITLHSAGTP